MLLADTHIHLYAEEFEADRSQLIEEARSQGVGLFLMPNIDAGSVAGMMELAAGYKGVCLPMMGLHPCYIKEDFRDQLSLVKKHLFENRDQFVGVGEIGLDFYWDLTFKKEQELAFREQAMWAHELGLPISIHSRNSTAELITILRDLKLDGLKGVFHCFSGDMNQADEVMHLGFHLGIGGVVTFKNSSLAEIVRQVPLEYIVLETDGPYLAPAPFRGKRNVPAYLRLIAEKIASLKNLSLETIAAQTTRNARLLFNLPE